MFKKELIKRLDAIFQLKQGSTFNAPSAEFEQEKLFVNVTGVVSQPRNKKICFKVEGFLQFFSQHEKIPFGYMQRALETASYENTAGLFLFQVDQEIANSQARMVNLSERRAQFVFLYSIDFNPNQGSLSSLETC